jgi:hypothetical protein
MTDAVLMITVLGVIVVALVVDVTMLIGWLRRRRLR